MWRPCAGDFDRACTLLPAGYALLFVGDLDGSGTGLTFSTRNTPGAMLGSPIAGLSTPSACTQLCSIYPTCEGVLIESPAGASTATCYLFQNTGNTIGIPTTTYSYSFVKDNVRLRGGGRGGG